MSSSSAYSDRQREEDAARERMLHIAEMRVDGPEAGRILEFGKHRGKAFRDVPVDYLVWLVENTEHLGGRLYMAITMYLDAMFVEYKRKYRG